MKQRGGQMWSEIIVTQWTKAKCGNRIYHTADIDQMWSRKFAPRRRTMSHSGLRPNMVQIFAPRWRTLSRSGLRPNVVQTISHSGYRPNVVKKNCPSSEDYVTQRTSTKCGPNSRPSSEDFVTQRTSTKCGPEYITQRI